MEEFEAETVEEQQSLTPHRLMLSYLSYTTKALAS